MFRVVSKGFRGFHERSNGFQWVSETFPRVSGGARDVPRESYGVSGTFHGMSAGFCWDFQGFSRAFPLILGGSRGV